MAACSHCGKPMEASEPRVLMGTKLFQEPAGNGREWVGTPPSVRYWKTIALVSLNICDECVIRGKKANIKKRILFCVILLGIVVALFVIGYLLPQDDVGAFLNWLGCIVSFVIIVRLLGGFNILWWLIRHGPMKKAITTEDVLWAAADRYAADNRIPRRDILALPPELEVSDGKDLEYRKTVFLKDHYTGPDTTYDLMLVEKEQIPQLPIKYTVNGQHFGLAEAMSGAEMLYETL